MKHTLVILLFASLVASACGGNPTATPSSTTATTMPTTTTQMAPTTSSTTVPSEPLDPPADCPTGFGQVAWIELSEPVACMRVALHQQLVVQNSTATPVEIQWNGIDSEVAVEDVFVTDGVISDYLGVGVHRLESQPVEITLVVVDPETRVFVVEPMMLRKWGPVTVGSTVEEAESALGGRLVFPDSEFVGGSECQYAYVEHDPYSPGFMILDGTTVARIDATAPEHHTASGIRLGSTTDEVLAAYGDVIERNPHAYVDGEYLTLVPNDEVDAAYRVVFATNEADEVTGFQNGLEGPANWVEGCA